MATNKLDKTLPEFLERSAQVKKYYNSVGNGLIFKFNPHNNNTLDQSQFILVHTNLIMSYVSIPSFIFDNSLVVTQIQELLQKETGPLLFSATARPHFANAQTVSIWKNPKDLAAFYYQGNHKDVMKRWENSAYALGAYAERFTISKLDFSDNNRLSIEKLWYKVFNDHFPKWIRPDAKK